MKSVLRSAAAIAALSGVCEGTHAASSLDEIEQIRSQLQGVTERMDRLEQENNALKAENESLKAHDEYLRAETRGLRKDAATQASEVGKIKGADWAAKTAIKGDMRYRYEMISDDTVNGAGVATADRYRDRIRARVNIEANPAETLRVGVGLTTTENNDPRSGNQTLTDVFSRKSVDLDLAYFDWRFAPWGELIGGKMKQPFYKQQQSGFWDNDVNPEGLALAFNRGAFFGSLYNFWVKEVSGLENTLTADASLAGVQLGARLPAGSGELVLAAHYYDLSAGQGRSPFYNGSSNGNSTVNVGSPPVAILVNDYEVANLTAEYNMTLAGQRLQLWTDLAQNQAVDDLDTAWAAGVLFGKASEPRTWELSADYRTIEKDALFAQLIDSDFAGGFSDVQGWVFRAVYAPLKNWTLIATYFLNQRNMDVANSAGQTDVDYDRLQVDFNVKF
jgi:hypothetical protein